VEEVVIAQKLRTYNVMKLAALREELKRVYEEVKSRGDDISALDRDIELLRRLYITAAGELESLLKHRHGGRVPREARELYAVAAEVGRFLEERLRALSARRLPDA